MKYEDDYDGEDLCVCGHTRKCHYEYAVWCGKMGCDCRGFQEREDEGEQNENVT